MIIDEDKITKLFDFWCNKLRVSSYWDVRIEYIDDYTCIKTGDIKIDCTDRKAVLLLNRANPKQENFEEVIVHELFHLKMYPLDQVTESLITANFKEGTPECNFAYNQFFTSLEQTVEELTKCFLLEFGDNKELSYGRCRNQKSFNELFEGLNSIK